MRYHACSWAIRKHTQFRPRVASAIKRSTVVSACRGFRGCSTNCYLPCHPCGYPRGLPRCCTCSAASPKDTRGYAFQDCMEAASIPCCTQKARSTLSGGKLLCSLESLNCLALAGCGLVMEETAMWSASLGKGFPGTQESCLEACLADQDCVGLTLQKGTCVLRAKLKTPKKYAGVTTYILCDGERGVCAIMHVPGLYESIRNSGQGWRQQSSVQR